MLIKDFQKRIHKNDTVLDASRKILHLINETYEPNRDIQLQLQLCGFDGNTPQVYLIITKNGLIKPLPNGGLTGTAGIIAFGRTKQAQLNMQRLNNLIAEEDVLAEQVREFISQAISFENNWSKTRGEIPKTGIGVNIVVLYPQKVVWIQPRFNSEDDPYQLHI